MHRFEERYQGWGGGRPSQEEAALISGGGNQGDRLALAARGRAWYYARRCQDQPVRG